MYRFAYAYRKMRRSQFVKKSNNSVGNKQRGQI